MNNLPPTIQELSTALGVDLLSKSRKREVVWLRFAVWFFLREKYHYSYTKIGLMFDKNHASVRYGVKEFYMKFSLAFTGGLTWECYEKVRSLI